MKSKWIITFHVLITVVLAWGLGFSQAGVQAKTPELEQSSLSAGANHTFLYQGVLKENGALVTGTRSFTFVVHNVNGCTDAGVSFGPKNVSVANGLFSTTVDGVFDASGLFVGSDHWLEVKVNSTAISCEAVLPVPYAHSLPVGAEITGNSGSQWAALYVEDKATSGNGTGVVGVSNDAGGYGIYGKNNAGGVAVYSDGKFYNTENSILLVSPLSGMSRWDTTGFDLLPMESGYLSIVNNGGSQATKYIVFPVSAFSTQFGSQVYAVDFEICYKSTNSSKAYIDSTQVLKNNSGPEYALMLSNYDTNSSETRACYTKSGIDNYLINNSIWIQLRVTLAPGEWMNIYSIKLTLSEEE